MSIVVYSGISEELLRGLILHIGSLSQNYLTSDTIIRYKADFGKIQ